ncbi:hypothetical protein, conserved in Apicomplexan species [Plasmodium ovale wallikeri]|uniref:Enhancer of polycomb-like protein n=2 Tax=Plasmodium ovale TaxID=36330 RepID=A0A1A8ZV73_PLAOA|nr:hypothetical protein, conserved in Apicomplexan species [Plasmodium ovale wallikeri]SBT47789.1 hypothetical protein, conserved in Apicomplexan species [Plasmodium ovale wallikeri]SBT82333.1 conserved Plasmodium protein, unknown function [Plasmodium ovale]
MTKGVEKHGKNSKHKPIDITKRLLIIKSNDDIKKLIKKENPTDEEVYELKCLLENSEVKAEKKKRNIIIPRFKICEDGNYKLSKFEKPTHYIRYELYRDQVTGIKLSDGTIIHYDLLKEDELFLESLNSYLNIQVNEEDFCKLIDKFEKLTGHSENKEEINLKDALKAAVELKINYKSNIIKDIHTYWKAKRKKLGRPLLRLFWNNSQNILPHYSVFRSRVKEKMTLRKHKKKNSEIILKMQELIDDFRRLDRILRKMKQRDEKKLLLLQLNSILFDQRKNEIKDKTYVCPMWNYFKDYKIEKIYKKFKKEKYYKNLYINNNVNNDSIISRKISKKMKNITGGLCDNMNILKINPNEYKNVVLIKRRGRNNRIWVDRKYVNDLNYDDMNCCDLSYTFKDFVDASLNLKKNYEEDVCNYLSGKQKHIPIKLDIKSVDLKNLDSNFFSNSNKNVNKQGENNDDQDGTGVLLEQYDEIKKEKKRRKRKKDDMEKANQTGHRESSVPPLREDDELPDSAAHSHLFSEERNSKSYPINGSNNYNHIDIAGFSNSLFCKTDEERLCSILHGKYAAEDVSNECGTGGVHNGFTVGETLANNGNMHNNDPNATTSMAVANRPDACEGTNKNDKNSSPHHNQLPNHKSLFHFEDMINPQMNRDNYVFCLSRYACVQKRILFYLENILNFDNFNFKSKKWAEGTINSSQNTPGNASTSKTTKGKNNQESKVD